MDQPAARAATGTRRGTLDLWELLGEELPAPAAPASAGELLWREFSAHHRWYSRAARRNRVAYQVFKVAALVVGAVVPVLAATGARPWLTATVAAAVVACEALQQLFQFHENWISYRTAAEQLRQEGFGYAAHVAPYDDPATRDARLAQVMRETTSGEGARWVRTARRPPAGPGTPSTSP
ncbi:DUF4231 domain-containing protein [Kineococcus glutinatus]|uniref:DUF4231 domain-containing protein n=1 Tax=Kineococcus glutinatus TaxID=1070872 RepID=UPI0031EF4E0D